MHRLLFQKVDDGVFLSHLDLIRAFQRAFQRAGLMLKHSQGFSPKPYVSVALALSVGVHSVCELMDFELENDAPIPMDLPQRLNATLPAGICVLECYESTRKVKEISYLIAKLTLEYDNGVPNTASEEIRELFQKDEIVVLKHGKHGDTPTNIAPMVKELSILGAGEKELFLRTTVCAQNPSLNPMLLLSAIEKYLPHLTPNFAWCCREDILDAAGNSFR
jgi:radical SAM-linked protein